MERREVSQTAMSMNIFIYTYTYVQCPSSSKEANDIHNKEQQGGSEPLSVVHNFKMLCLHPSRCRTLQAATHYETEFYDLRCF